MIETICKELNLKIRQDKEARKSLGLTLKEKDRKRELLTELGRIEIARDYYQDKKNNRYVYPLDHAVGIRKYERVGDIISARMVSLATEMSYAKSAEIGRSILRTSAPPLTSRTIPTSASRPGTAFDP